MTDVEQLLFDLHVCSGSSRGYFLTRDAVNLRLVCGEDWDPSLKALHREVTKLNDCSYDDFRKLVQKTSEIAWEKNAELLKKYAHRDLEQAPAAQDFIEILYTYILRNR